MRRQKMNMMTLCLIPIGISVNFVGAQIANILKLPVYLDSIGTILTAALCGVWPGALTGVLSCLITGITYPTDMLYFPVTAMYGVIAALLAKRGWMRKPKTVLLLGLLVALTGVTLATPITAFVYGGITETGQSFLIIALRSFGMNVLSATLISSTITECVDKILVAFIAFVVIKSMSGRYLSKFPLGPVYLNKNNAKHP